MLGRFPRSPLPADLIFLAAERDQITALAVQTQQAPQALDAGVGQMTARENRARYSLKGKYGAQNEKLEEFGIKPRRSRTAAKPG